MGSWLGFLSLLQTSSGCFRALALPTAAAVQGSIPPGSGSRVLSTRIELLFFSIRGQLMSSVFMQAPYTPFLTELMYQNLKLLIDPVSVQDKDTHSIHYLMLPHVR